MTSTVILGYSVESQPFWEEHVVCVFRVEERTHKEAGDKQSSRLAEISIVLSFI
jgi:hypothetical protein